MRRWIGGTVRPPPVGKTEAAAFPASVLAKRNAAMQHCCMNTLTLSKRGSLTLPPELRRKLGLDKLRNPLLLVEERDGGLFLQPAVALPVRDLPKAQLQAWIARDEADMKLFRAARKGPRK